MRGGGTCATYPMTRFHCAQNKLVMTAWDSASVQQYLKSWCAWLCIQCRLTTTRSDLIWVLMTIYGRCMFWKQGSVDVCSSMSFKTISDYWDPMRLTTHNSFNSYFKVSSKNVVDTILGLRLERIEPENLGTISGNKFFESPKLNWIIRPLFASNVELRFICPLNLSSTLCCRHQNFMEVQWKIYCQSSTETLERF